MPPDQETITVDLEVYEAMVNAIHDATAGISTAIGDVRRLRGDLAVDRLQSIAMTMNTVLEYGRKELEHG